jgi:hypothetical protein
MRAVWSRVEKDGNEREKNRWPRHHSVDIHYVYVALYNFIRVRLFISREIKILPNAICDVYRVRII